MTDPTTRFSNRVADYIRYRPSYPLEILAPLESDCGLMPESTIADVGSGTGLLAERFLSRGNRVFGVEPNREMREAGERLLASFDRFTSIAGTAEATTLPDRSLDFVTAGQAFHWFDRPRARGEFARILRPGGFVVLVWNDRRTDTTEFLVDYEKLLVEFATDYAQVDHRRMDAAVLSEFFGSEPSNRTFLNLQHCDRAALKGRLLSSSYVPAVGQPRHEAMLSTLERLFDAHQQDGGVTLEYDTRLYYGRLA